MIWLKISPAKMFFLDPKKADSQCCRNGDGAGRNGDLVEPWWKPGMSPGI